MSAKPGAGEPLKLMAFQRRFIYGVMYHHESALTIARGNGKTTLTAALAAAAIAGPLAAARAQTVVVAASLGQARLAFGHTKWFLRDIFRQEPKLWRVIEHSHECRIENRETGAMMRAIGSDPRRAHGLAPVLVITDEPAQWPVNDGQRMYTALMTALGKHQFSRLIAIGTRPDDSHHWFSRMLYGRRRATYAQVHAAATEVGCFSACMSASSFMAFRSPWRIGVARHRLESSSSARIGNSRAWRPALLPSLALGNNPGSLYAPRLLTKFGRSGGCAGCHSSPKNKHARS